MLGMPKGRQILRDNGIRVTLIARDVHTPYSGMLPGFVAGHYSYDAIHLDLQKLCQFSGIRLFHTSAVGIEVNANGIGGRILCTDGRPPVRYDAVSIDIGSSPAGTPPKYVTPVKPIAHFCAQYERLQETLVGATRYTPENPFVVLVVGGGAGGIELALSVQYNLQGICKQQGLSPDCVKIIVATRSDTIMEQHNRRVQRKFQRVLRERGIEVRYGAEAVSVELVATNGSGGERGTIVCARSGYRANRFRSHNPSNHITVCRQQEEANIVGSIQRPTSCTL